jgi:hypothetical protein
VDGAVKRWKQERDLPDSPADWLGPEIIRVCQEVTTVPFGSLCPQALSAFVRSLIIFSHLLTVSRQQQRALLLLSFRTQNAQPSLADSTSLPPADCDTISSRL